MTQPLSISNTTEDKEQLLIRRLFCAPCTALAAAAGLSGRQVRCMLHNRGRASDCQALCSIAQRLVT
jgi:hypothetical protein